MSSEWSWLMERDSPFRNYLNLGGNIVFFLLVAMVLVDYNGFQTSLECKAWKPMIDLAKHCPYGVKLDLCYAFPIPNPNFTTLNATQKPYGIPGTYTPIQ